MCKKFLTALVALLFSHQLLAAGAVVINGKEIKSQEALNTLLIKELKFPKFYAKTLDSLYDVLSTDFTGNIEIRIKHLSFLKGRLGADYTDSLIQTISDASNDNPKIILLLE